ncbi:MAG: response regulator, partial [Myxococcota bacterium]
LRAAIQAAPRSVLVIATDATSREAICAPLRYTGIQVHAPDTAIEWQRRLGSASLVLIDDGLSEDTLADVLGRAQPDAALVHVRPLVGPRHDLTGQDPRVISLYLPLRQRPLLENLLELSGSANPTDTTRQNVRQRSALRVLVAEDNSDNRAVARAILKGAGHSAHIVRDGVDAVTAALTSTFDVILMDLHMPRMDGLQAIEEIHSGQAQLGQPLTPIVAHTAHATEEIREKALALGVREFVTKPARRQRLLEALARAASRQIAVLVVDDAPDSRRLLEHYLKKDARYQVYTAASGDEAMSILRRIPMQLILMDVEMPGRTGDDVIAELRANGDTRPAIAVTGHTEQQKHHELMAAGFNAIMTKPINSTEVLEVVSQHLAQSEPSTHPTAEIDTELRALVPLFLDDRRDNITALMHALEEGDAETIRRLGHMMKGNGAAYGFNEITTLGRQLEIAGTANDLKGAAKLTLALETYLDTVEIIWVDSTAG